MRILIVLVILTLLVGCQTTGKAVEKPKYTLPLSNLDKATDASGNIVYINRMVYAVEEGDDYGEAYGVITSLTDGKVTVETWN